MAFALSRNPNQELDDDEEVTQVKDGSGIRKVEARSEDSCTLENLQLDQPGWEVHLDFSAVIDRKAIKAVLTNLVRKGLVKVNICREADGKPSQKIIIKPSLHLPPEHTKLDTESISIMQQAKIEVIFYDLILLNQLIAAKAANIIPNIELSYKVTPIFIVVLVRDINEIRNRLKAITELENNHIPSKTPFTATVYPNDDKGVSISLNRMPTLQSSQQYINWLLEKSFYDFPPVNNNR